MLIVRKCLIQMSAWYFYEVFMRRLTHGKYGFILELEENVIYEIVAENPVIFASMIKELSEQMQGGSGEFRLSQGEKSLSLEKKVVFIRDIFNLDINQRNILSKLYTELGENASDTCLQERSIFIESYINYMDAICNNSDLFVMYEEEPDVQELFKLAKLKIDSEAVTPLELIIEYITVVSRLLRVDIIVFLNLKLFLSQEELEKLYEECFQRKVCLILLEASFQERMLCERGCIIDKDSCIIYF